MDLLNGEPDSCDVTRVKCTLDGHDLVCIGAERVSDISEEADQETTVPKIKTEPNLSGVPVEQKASTNKRRKNVCSVAQVMTSEPMTLNDLPDEILLHILSHFGLEDLCLIIAKVCEKWKVLAKDMIVWKKLSYSCDPSTDINHIKKVLTDAPTLYSLIIRYRDDVADILEFLNQIPSDLKKLIIEDCWFGENGTGLLANIVDLYPDLESLSLEGCYPLTFDDYCLIPRLKKLSELNLS